MIDLKISLSPPSFSAFCLLFKKMNPPMATTPTITAPAISPPLPELGTSGPTGDVELLGVVELDGVSAGAGVGGAGVAGAGSAGAVVAVAGSAGSAGVAGAGVAGSAGVSSANIICLLMAISIDESALTDVLIKASTANERNFICFFI